MDVLGLADMELTFSTAAHRCYSWQSPALLVATKQLLEVASEFLLLICTPNNKFIFFFLLLRLGSGLGLALGLGLGLGLYLLSLLSCNYLTSLPAFLLHFAMLQEKEASKQLCEHLALSYSWPTTVN